MAEGLWTPYRPPQRSTRGWRVGPLQTVMDLAVGDGDGLPAAVTVDQLISVDLAACDGDGLVADCTVGSIVDVTVDMLPAVGDGDGLVADSTVDQSIAMNLADGSGGTALAPTLSIANPPVFFSGGNNARGTSSSASQAITFSDTSVPAGSDVIVLVFVYMDTNGTAAGPTAVTYGGTPMTLQQSQSPTGAIFRCYKIQNPGSGTKAFNATLNRSGGTTMGYLAMSVIYTGAAGGVAASGGTQASTANPSMTAGAAAVGSLVVGGFGGRTIAGITGLRTINNQNVVHQAVGDQAGNGSALTFSGTAAAAAWGGIWAELAA